MRLMKNTRAMSIILALISVVLFNQLLLARAQDAPQTATNRSPQGLPFLALTLQELSNPFSVVCVAARVEDADFHVLAYYRYKFGARIGVIFATRGESGGDAVITSGENAPGITTTRDALKACNRIGADAYFLNLADFGYSKSPDEVLSRWGKEKADKRLVDAIRRLRADILITPHSGQIGDGYQQAIGRLLREAFGAAADTNVATAPNSEVWQPRRLYLKTDFGDSDTFVNLFESNHLLGGSYAEIETLRHKAMPRIQQAEKSFYKLVVAASGEKPPFGTSFFEGLTLPENLAKSLAPRQVKGRPLAESLPARDALAQALIEALVEKRAEGSVETLRERYGADFFRVVRHVGLLERALALTLGINLELRLDDETIAQGETTAAELSFHNGSDQPLSLVFHTPESLSPLNGKISFRQSEVLTAPPFSRTVEQFRLESSLTTPLTLPHSKHLYDEQFYPAERLRLSTEPFGSSLAAYAEIRVGPVTIPLAALRKFDVAPPVELSVSPPFAFVRDWTEPREVELTVRARNRSRGASKGALWIVPLALTNDSYEPLRLSFAQEDEEVVIKVPLTLPIMKPPLSPDILIEFRKEQPASPEALAAVKIPVQTLDCTIADGLKVAYIGRRDSPLPPALALLVGEQTALTVEDIGSSQHGVSSGTKLNQSCADLSRFNTIVVDALAFSATPDLLAKNRCLLEYARRGGNLIILYQRHQFWDHLFNRSIFSPFPLALSDHHLIGENTPVKLLNSEHPLMQKPNAISEKDFDGWARNRALYLPKHWTTDYEALLEAADTGEESRKGLLLVSRYEAGFFVYTSLDLPQQLTLGNPGAYRLLANLLSLPKHWKTQ